MKSSILLTGVSLAAGAMAQGAAWAQCGGQGWTGATTCVSGYYCYLQNPYYSQCIPGTVSTTAKAATTTAEATSASTAVPTTLVTKTFSAATAGGTTAHFKWFGVDESGAEFTQTSLPGVYGTDFIFPSSSTIDTLMSEGFNIFRIPFLMERMAPTSLAGPLATAYLTNYTGTIEYITSKGGYAIIDPHNSGRYNGAVITDYAGFGTFWQNLAAHFQSNTNAIFDTNNEYHDMDQALVLNLNQAAINGIRAAGATSQYIFVEGNGYTGAYSWNTTNDNLKALTDPQNMLIYEMHQYLDSDSSGTSATCVSSTIGLERVEGATAWLRANGKKGILGEFAGGNNDVCKDAVTGMLQHMKANNDVWMGALWWGGGPWWGDYIYGFEPPSSTAYSSYLSLLESLM